jgi:WD40 repeat protein
MALDSVVHLWDVASLERLRTLEGWPGPIRSLVFSPDGEYLIAGGPAFDYPKNKIARVWRLDHGEVVAALRGHKWGIYSIAFSDDGRYVATAAGDGTIRVWRTSTWKCVKRFRRPKVTITGVRFSSSESGHLVAGYEDQVVIWDWRRGREVEVIKGEGDLVALAKGADSYPWRLLGIGPGDARVELEPGGKYVLWYPADCSIAKTAHTGVKFGAIEGNSLKLFEVCSSARQAVTLLAGIFGGARSSPRPQGRERSGEDAGFEG